MNMKLKRSSYDPKQDAWVMRKSVRGLANKEVILNKNSEVYPKFSFDEFCSSDEGKKYIQHLEANSGIFLLPV